MLLRTSPIRHLSDSIVTDGSEMIRCEGRRDFSGIMAQLPQEVDGTEKHLGARRIWALPNT
jgi:hypothetical protein